MITLPESLALLADLDEAGCGGSTLAEKVRLLLADYNRLLAASLASSRRPDYDRLLASLDEDRTEAFFPLADLAADEGRAGEARGWGWLASCRKWPARQRTARGDVYAWDCRPATSGEHSLPATLWEALRRTNAMPVLQWRTPSAALLAVVRVIADGHWTPSHEKSVV